MHPGVTATAAVAFLVAGVGSVRGVLPLRLPQSRVATVRVGRAVLEVRLRVVEVRLAAVHSRLVHAYFELAWSGDRCAAAAAAAMVVLVEGVKVVAVTTLSTQRCFDQ